MKRPEPHPDLFDFAGVVRAVAKEAAAVSALADAETAVDFDFEAAADLTDWTPREVPVELRFWIDEVE